MEFQEKHAFSSSEDNFSRSSLRFGYHAGMTVSCLYRVDSLSIEQNQARPIRHCEIVSKLLGLMTAASNMIPFGPLYMKSLQWWLKNNGFSQRGNTFCMIKITCRCLCSLVVWKKPWFLSQRPVLGVSCCHKTFMTDASLICWGAVLEGHSTRGLWRAHHLSWNINFLEI